MYKKEYEQVFEIKDENCRKKYDYKNLKGFNYQVYKTKKEEDKTKKGEDKTGKEENKTGQELPLWIKSKDEKDGLF